MLHENIKAIRKSKGLSQEELAIKLNVVRQTISKWEQGVSVPDSDMLISLSEALETPVSTLLGETVAQSKVDDLKAISEKLEIINLQLTQRKSTRRNPFLPFRNRLPHHMQLLRQRFLGISFFLSQYFDVITQHNCVLRVFDGPIIR